MLKEGEVKNEEAFEKMKGMMEAPQNKVFDYQQKGEDDDVEEQIQDDIEMPDEDDELEYSAEQLEEFMESLGKTENMASNTQKSDKLISNFL